MDKLEKVPLDTIEGDLAELGLDRSVVEKLTEVMTKKSIDSIREVLGADSGAVKQLEQLISLCEAYGISDWIIVDPSVIRGLAYYTGIVFEAFDRQGQLRAIAGGGRYNQLVQTFGGDPIPACGFGFGDAVIVELLKERKILPSFASSGFDTVVFAMSPDLYQSAIDVASTLRRAGQSVDVILEDKKPKWVFKHADRLGAKYCAVIRTDEIANGEVSIKDLKLGDQKTVKIDNLANWAKASEA
jgi:histidyl-tRNA synthetase